MRFGEGPQTADRVRFWIRREITDRYRTWGFGKWAVVERSSDEVMGYCGLARFNDLGWPEPAPVCLVGGRHTSPETAAECPYVSASVPTKSRRGTARPTRSPLTGARLSWRRLKPSPAQVASLTKINARRRAGAAA